MAYSSVEPAELGRGWEGRSAALVAPAAPCVARRGRGPARRCHAGNASRAQAVGMRQGRRRPYPCACTSPPLTPPSRAPSSSFHKNLSSQPLAWRFATGGPVPLAWALFFVGRGLVFLFGWRSSKMRKKLLTIRKNVKHFF